MKFSFIALPTLALLLHSCSQTNPEPKFKLPPVSAVGANTLGFETKGRVWINYGQRCFRFGGGCSDNKINAHSGVYNGIRGFSITAGLTSGERDEYFSLHIDTLRGTGTYQASPYKPDQTPQSFSIPTKGLTLKADNNDYYYISRNPNAAKIILTRVDTVNQIVSGTFEGRLEDMYHPGTYRAVSKGRFDVIYSR